MKLDECSALITGASAGIGREIARQLAPRARQLILVARRTERLEELRTALMQRHPARKIITRGVDLSEGGQLNSLTDWLQSENLQIDLLVNNAGLGDLGSFATANPERLEQMIQVNIKALTLLARAVLPSMIANRKGAIL